MRVQVWMRWSAFVLLMSLPIGCGPSESTDAPKENNSTAAATTPGETQSAADNTAAPTVSRFQQPDEAVRQFLSALKAGDQSRATSMLSVKAQKEMARTDAAIRPPGSNTADFKVTEVEYLGPEKSGAHVLSTWTDKESGKATTHEIVWILRHEDGGWAIAGMATKVFEDQPPLILNFEDPLDAQRKRTAVDAEIARRTQPAETTAKAPAKEKRR